MFGGVNIEVRQIGTVSGYDILTVCGMNEAGLNASLLWLNATDFPEGNGTTPRMALSIWAQLYLDQFATVSEAFEYVRSHPVDVASGEVPGRPGSLTPLHLTLSNAIDAVPFWSGPMGS